MDFRDIEGKTIATATLLKYENFDDEGWLRLTFTDGTGCIIVSTYGGYTGHSIDEYPSYLGIRSIDDDGEIEDSVDARRHGALVPAQVKI